MVPRMYNAQEVADRINAAGNGKVQLARPDRPRRLDDRVHAGPGPALIQKQPGLRILGVLIEGVVEHSGLTGLNRRISGPCQLQIGLHTTRLHMDAGQKHERSAVVERRHVIGSKGLMIA